MLASSLPSSLLGLQSHWDPQYAPVRVARLSVSGVRFSVVEQVHVVCSSPELLSPG